MQPKVGWRKPIPTLSGPLVTEAHDSMAADRAG
jgi:hypothetical protein